MKESKIFRGELKKGDKILICGDDPYDCDKGVFLQFDKYGDVIYKNDDGEEDEVCRWAVYPFNKKAWKDIRKLGRKIGEAYKEFLKRKDDLEELPDYPECPECGDWQGVRMVTPYLVRPYDFKCESCGVKFRQTDDGFTLIDMGILKRNDPEKEERRENNG